MRVDNILMVQQVPNSHMTLHMYVPRNAKCEDMGPQMLKRLLCPKNLTKDWRVCQTCMSGCKPGNLLVSMMTGETALPVTAKEAKSAPRIDKLEKRKAGNLSVHPHKASVEQLQQALKAILAGGDHEAIAKELGYSNWHGMHAALKRRNISVQELPGWKDRQAEAVKSYFALVKLEKTAKLKQMLEQIAGGMNREDAARAAGYSRWNKAREACKRYGVDV